ncbi:hypothetical protein M8C21_002672 [Ambrosia artemisiifolia]|uniref:Protein LURP-one-related 15 n=1 Tax=Ambrosia artemisiifolia TaxID=4212 RepID=A0AAD5G2G7_AMBAR|nr:hypothetical protein M8C21_002672 [Ambrosia artemisiifolia]
MFSYNKEYSVCVVTMAQPTPIIGSKFIAPYEFNVIVNRCESGDLVITDIQGKTMFTITSCDSFLHRQRLVQDEKEKPIATLRAKNRTAHDRWNVFRGRSKDDSNMIFSTATNKMFQNQNIHMHIGQPERYMVTIYPNVDYAFVAVLIATVETMNTPGRVKGAGKAAGQVAVDITKGVAQTAVSVASVILFS